MTIHTGAITSREPLTLVPGGASIPWPPDDPRYAPDARQALAEAQRDAASLGHNHLGPPHIFVTALARVPRVTADALAGLGVTHAGAQATFGSVMGRVSAPMAPQDLTLTPLGQNAIERAMHEATRMHHAAVRAEHLALAAIIVDTSVVSRILAALGTSRDDAMAAIIATLRVPPSYRAAEHATATDGPYERFDEDAKRILALAEQEAIDAGDRGINSHYFLRGLARLAEGGDSPAAERIMRALGITSATIRAEADKLRGPGTRVERSQLFLTASAKLVIEHALHNAGTGTVRPEHLLIAIETAHDAMAGYMLKQLGVTPERVRALLS
jgi:ATP-dependent Clp protease ATP-binding subunit ClpA